MKWPSVQLEDLCTKVGSGATPRGGGDSYQQSGIALVRSMNVHNGRFKPDDLAFIDENQAAKLNNVVLEPNDVLLNITGASVARCCTLDNSVLPGRVNQHVCILRPKPSKLSYQYLMRFLTADQTQKKLLGIAGAGATREAITKAELLKFTIPLPPLAEQKRIAAILDAADALRAKRREALAELDALLQSTFLTLFGDPVANPMGWKAVCLRSVADLENGDRSSNYPSGPDVLDAGVLFLSTKNISDNQLVFNNCQFISEKKFKSLSRGKLRRNDLVITLRGTLGSCAIFDCEFETGFINAQILILHPSEQIVSTYLHALITTERMKRHFEELSTGVAVKQLTGKQIGDLSIPLPPLPLQQKFAAIVESIERQKTTQRAHLAELDALFAALQHRAFRGEL